MLDAEQEELRRTVRTLLNRRSDKRRTAFDPELWRLMAEQIGAHALAIPEEYGGAGFTVLESHIVLEELGAALTPTPFGSTALAAQAILGGTDEAARQRLLPDLAAGATIATLAWAEDSGSWDVTTIRSVVDEEGRLTGVKHHVLDGDDAGVFVVPAVGADGLGLYAVLRPDAVVTPDLVKQRYHAGNLVKALAQIVGGGGGGRPDMAQAGGRDLAKLDAALAAVGRLVGEQGG